MGGYIRGLSTEAEVLLVLSAILFAGFILTRLTNLLRLPRVSGYILTGILIGPSCLDLIPGNIITNMSFLSDLALSFIAFSVGKFLKREVVKKTGKRLILVSLSETLLAGLTVTATACWGFSLEWEFSMILGAIATATAPAGTMMIIRQYHARGEFVNVLFQVVALDNIVCLLAFSVVSAVANGNMTGQISPGDIAWPVACNLVVLVLGFVCGWILSMLLVVPSRSKDNRLILAVAMLLGLAGTCAALSVSPLLCCMVFGSSYINLTEDKALYDQIDNFTPPIMSFFFILSGMNLDLGTLKDVGTVGLAYFFVRIIAKYLGTYVSCSVLKLSREICRYMGLALIPQAGVAIGLAFLGKRMLPSQMGDLLLTVILASSVLYELVGPASAKFALSKAGVIQVPR